MLCVSELKYLSDPILRIGRHDTRSRAFHPELNVLEMRVVSKRADAKAHEYSHVHPYLGNSDLEVKLLQISATGVGEHGLGTNGN